MAHGHGAHPPAAAAPAPAPSNPSQPKRKGLSNGGLLSNKSTVSLIVIVALLVIGTRALENWRERERIAEAARQADRQARIAQAEAVAQAAPKGEGGLIARDRCFTPCTTIPVEWPYEIHGDGYDLEVTPDGSQPFKYPGHGEFDLPPIKRGTKLGLKSLDPQITRVKVILYERIR